MSQFQRNVQKLSVCLYNKYVYTENTINQNIKGRLWKKGYQGDGDWYGDVDGDDDGDGDGDCDDDNNDYDG